ncbi:MAG: KOW motif-containing protein [Bacteroidaceae bacterium]|nr:KOW motif-containing protein [Bacteroidaceae bacterium]
MMENEKRWCILRHSDSDLIGEIFSGKRKVFNASEGDVHPLPPFEYFIPFADLRQKPADRHSDSDDEYKSYDAVLDERALRNDLHHFIFICATKEQVLSILDAPWIKMLQNRLYAYRDEKGVPFEISNSDLERFKTILKRFDFQIINGDPSEDVQTGDEVIVTSGPMAGSEGKVKEIHERDGQILLTIELPMFMNRMRIAVPDINIADVRIKGEKAQQLLQDPVIGRFEDELIELLCHLHGKKGSRQLNQEDQKQLRFLYQYSDIVFEDNPVDQAKFAALMLICVYLMNDKEEVTRRTKEVEELLIQGSGFMVQGSENEKSEVGGLKAEVEKDSSRVQEEGKKLSTFNFQLSTDSKLYTLSSKLNEIAVYLIIALFIVKHEVQLRQQAKAWCQSHPDCPLVIRRFLSIAKQIRC